MTDRTSAASWRHRLAAAAVPLVLLAAACQSDDHDVRGTVTGRAKKHQGKWTFRYLAVRRADGATVRFRVGQFSSAWRRCHVGDRYPECAR